MKKIDEETLYADEALRTMLSNAKSRCYNPAHPEFPRYGARGVTICARWLATPNSFVAWAINKGGYKPGLYLDRRDNKKGYTPQNTRFITPLESTRNRRNTRSATFDGRTQTLMEWAQEWNLTYKTVYQRVQKGEKWPEISRPSRTPGRACVVAEKKKRPMKRGVRG